MRLEKRKITILNKVSTILTPGRTTLLLGPPGGGKVCCYCASSSVPICWKDHLFKQLLQIVWSLGLKLVIAIECMFMGVSPEALVVLCSVNHVLCVHVSCVMVTRTCQKDMS